MTNVGGLTWTRTPPTEAGWYLAYEIEDLRSGRDIFLVYVNDEGVKSHTALHGGNMSIAGDRHGNIWEFSYFSHWLGPISFPEGG